MITPKTRPIAEGKVLKSMRVLKSVLQAIEVEEVSTGKFDDACAFVQQFLTQYFEFGVLMRDPYQLSGSGKMMRTWHFDKWLLAQTELEAHKLRLKSAAALVNNLLVEYYQGNLITRKEIA